MSDSTKGLIDEIERQFGPFPPMTPKPRDWCDWCKGRGCAACFEKRRKFDAEYASFRTVRSRSSQRGATILMRCGNSRNACTPT